MLYMIFQYGLELVINGFQSDTGNYFSMANVSFYHQLFYFSKYFNKFVSGCEHLPPYVKS